MSRAPNRELSRQRAKLHEARTLALGAQLALARLLGDRHPVTTAAGAAVARLNEALAAVDEEGAA